MTKENGGGTGNGGKITINGYDNQSPVGELTVSDYSYISTSVDEGTTGKGGDLILNISHLTLDKVGKINSYSAGNGNAGDINITADNAFLSDKSLITTEATKASGGNIKFTGLTDLRLFNSQISAESMGEKPGDNGGNIIMNPPRLLILGKGSALLASANQGYGGNIRTINGNSLLGPVIVMQHWNPDKREKLRINNSVIDATSGKSVNGDVEIKGTLRDPTINPKSWREFLRDELSLSRCALFSNKKGKFFINARDILPIGPEDLRTQTIRLWSPK